jgi:ABC-type uncharacterized transport system auxiliary subunit
MTCNRLLILALMALLLAACASAPGIPDTVYHRLPEPEIATLPKPLSEHPVLVEAFLADGLHSDQALIYSTDPEGRRLQAYHYQRWVDPPSRMLQRRLIQSLRNSGAAAVVTDRLAARVDALRIQGRINAFDRLQQADGWQVLVALSLRAERSGADLPLLMKDYRVQLTTEGNSMADTTRSTGAALDQIFAQFLRDLADASAQ